MNIYNYTRSDLEDYFTNIGDKKFRAIQIYDWIYKKKIKNFSEMNNISKDIITHMEENFTINSLKILMKQEDKDVSKYLFELNDNEKIEAVLMKHNYGLSLCISTQVGCNMGCSFCESGKMKKARNLEVHEMINQILTIENDINDRISHVVLMGIGEPFDNYDNVISFVKILIDEKGLDKAVRHITVSTCGVIPKIKELTKSGLSINLAISLHAPNDKLRTELMPINKAYNLKELMSALNEYIKVTKRRLTYEYIMLEGINDTKECALELSKLIKGQMAYVNLIPYNETSSDFKRSKKVKILEFYDILKKNNIAVTIRKEFGSNVDAACGQLRSKH